MRWTFRLSLAAIALTMWIAAARGDGVVRDGVGAISTGRGGTNLGFADNAAIILDNPGAMSNAADNGFWELGVDTVMDMARTSVNLLGNCLASAVIARWEGHDLTPPAEALEEAA